MAGRLVSIAYDNGTQVDYGYDAGNRLTAIHHKVADGGATILRLEYEYVDDADNPNQTPVGEIIDGRPLIWRVTETDQNDVESRVTFTYDGLSRLVHEQRVDDATSGAVEYEFTYVYDKLGNRMRKIDHVKGFTTVYQYDVHEVAQGQGPDPFAAHNNWPRRRHFPQNNQSSVANGAARL